MDQPKTPTVLLSDPMLAGFEPALQAEGWRIARAWELTDAERQAARAVVHAGDILLPPVQLAALPNVGLIACVGAG